MRTRQYPLTEADQVTLGELIDGLALGKRDKSVTFDWNSLRPRSLQSYRGYYDQLALTFDNGDAKTVGELLDECVFAVDANFEGYKGGSFVMDRSTRIYVANYGTSSGIGVVGILVHGALRALLKLTLLMTFANKPKGPAVDVATRMLVRSAAKLLIEAMNHGKMDNEEQLRVHAAYRRLIIALSVERKTP